MILALNTAQKIHEMALIDKSQLLAEESWVSGKDTLEQLLSALKKMLADLALDRKEISELAVVSGPGPFSGLRTGIAFANALADALNIPLHSVDTFTLLKLKTDLEDPVLAVLNAGGLDVGILHGHEVKVGPLSVLLAAFPHDHSFHVVFEGTETQDEELRGICLEKKWKRVEGHELQSLAQVILTYGLEPFSLTKLCEAYYLKAPHITASTNPWKKP